MRYLIILLLLTSCYTKKRAIEKFCQQDTATTIIHDTIRTETIKTDSIFSDRVDSVYIAKDKLRIVYVKKNDSIYITGECIGDTIYYTREVKIPVFKENCYPLWWIWVLLGLAICFFYLFLAALKRK